MKPVVSFFTFSLPRYTKIGRHLWARFRFYNPEMLTPRYQQAVYRYTGSMLLTRRPGLVSRPYYEPELMALLHRHLPEWRDFQTEYYDYIQAQWSSIFGDWDWSTIKIVTNEEQPLLQRDRLMQIFGACPKGSYGYYAKRGLGPVKAVVGSFASAAIDEFFAKHVELLTQPFSELVNVMMSTQETHYWDTRKEFTDWLAGQLLGQSDRANVVRWAAELSAFLDDLPNTAGKDLTAEQLQEIRTDIEKGLPTLDDTALQDFLADDVAVLAAWHQLKAREK